MTRACGKWKCQWVVWELIEMPQTRIIYTCVSVIDVRCVKTIAHPCSSTSNVNNTVNNTIIIPYTEECPHSSELESKLICTMRLFLFASKENKFISTNFYIFTNIITRQTLNDRCFVYDTSCTNLILVHVSFLWDRHKSIVAFYCGLDSLAQGQGHKLFYYTRTLEGGCPGKGKLKLTRRRCVIKIWWW